MFPCPGWLLDVNIAAEQVHDPVGDREYQDHCLYNPTPIHCPNGSTVCRAFDSLIFGHADAVVLYLDMWRTLPSPDRAEAYGTTFGLAVAQRVLDNFIEGFHQQVRYRRSARAIPVEVSSSKLRLSSVAVGRMAFSTNAGPRS